MTGKAVIFAPVILNRATTLTYKGSPERLIYYSLFSFLLNKKKFSGKKMPYKDAQERQDHRVWCIEQLIRYEGCLDPRMYECADHAATIYNVKNKDALYTLWMDWKRNRPSSSPSNNRM